MAQGGRAASSFRPPTIVAAARTTCPAVNARLSVIANPDHSLAAEQDPVGRAGHCRWKVTVTSNVAAGLYPDGWKDFIVMALLQCEYADGRWVR